MSSPHLAVGRTAEGSRGSANASGSVHRCSEQLGLKLESAKVQVYVLVIDRVAPLEKLTVQSER